MKRLPRILALLVALSGLSACERSGLPDDGASHGELAHHEEAEPERGPHGGRMLREGDFSLELAIVEIGVPPEFRVWATDSGDPISPDDLDVGVTLTRLGGVVDEIAFYQLDDFLRGDAVVYEPHSFIVNVDASYSGKRYRWQYENFEGRVRIGADIAAAAGIVTERAGPATIGDAITVYGRVVSNPENVSHVTARFDGVIRSVGASIGERVARGQMLAVVEANDSLTSYAINAPIGGTIIEQHANPGETTAGRTLFTIVDPTSVWAEFAVFPSDRPRIEVGAPITARTVVGDIRVDGEIALLSPVAGNNQSVTARVRVDNREGLLAAGMYLTGEIEVAQYEVPLAVKRTGLQTFRDFTVVYAQVGEEYEVRMLELGRQDGTWAEVLGGLAAGTSYVTANSYVIKADIEKAGASHDH